MTYPQGEQPNWGNDPQQNQFSQPQSNYYQNPPEAPQGPSFNQVPFYQQAARPIPTYVASNQYPAGQYGMPQYSATSQKSLVGAALLAFFLGNLGVHSFYLGYTKRGAIQLGLTIFGWVSAILLIGFLFIFAVGVWALIDFIMILTRSGIFRTDSNGVPLQ